MLFNLAAAAAAVVLALLVFVATRPASFRIARSAVIKAPPEKLFAMINDYHQWPAWSPYEKLDPAMQRTYSGAASGTGAVYEWQGNRNIGKGRMEIVETAPPSRVTIKLDFFKPFEAHNTAEFTLVPRGDSTEVTWAMQGPSNFMSKAMIASGMMERMVGGQFAEGLANMKAAAEAKKLG